MEIDEPTSSTSNNPIIPSTASNMSSIDDTDSDEYEEEVILKIRISIHNPL